MKKLIEETKSKIDILEEKLKDIANELDIAWEEDNPEENNMHNELLDKKQYIETQIESLKNSLILLEKNKRAAKKSNVISLGRTAKIKMNGKEKNLTLVSPAQADPAKGLISAESPIGKALLGKSTGNKVEISTPAGIKRYDVVDIQ
jgi:transcription elongation factor GreA